MGEGTILESPRTKHDGIRPQKPSVHLYLGPIASIFGLLDPLAIDRLTALARRTIHQGYVKGFRPGNFTAKVSDSRLCLHVML